jgi:hypothetical protein
MSYLTTVQIDQLRDEAINAANSVAFGLESQSEVNIKRFNDAMQEINNNNLHFTKCAVLEEISDVLRNCVVDSAVLDLAYLHYNYSHDSVSAIKV